MGLQGKSDKVQVSKILKFTTFSHDNVRDVIDVELVLIFIFSFYKEHKALVRMANMMFLARRGPKKLVLRVKLREISDPFFFDIQLLGTSEN